MSDAPPRVADALLAWWHQFDAIDAAAFPHATTLTPDAWVRGDGDGRAGTMRGHYPTARGHAPWCLVLGSDRAASVVLWHLFWATETGTVQVRMEERAGSTVVAMRDWADRRFPDFATMDDAAWAAVPSVVRQSVLAAADTPAAHGIFLERVLHAGWGEYFLGQRAESAALSALRGEDGAAQWAAWGAAPTSPVVPTVTPLVTAGPLTVVGWYDADAVRLVDQWPALIVRGTDDPTVEHARSRPVVSRDLLHEPANRWLPWDPAQAPAVSPGAWHALQEAVQAPAVVAATRAWMRRALADLGWRFHNAGTRRQQELRRVQQLLHARPDFAGAWTEALLQHPSAPARTLGLLTLGLPRLAR